MIKKKIKGSSEFLGKLKGHKDTLKHFIMESGHFKGVALDATLLCNQMRANHELGILESYILGQAYIGSLLMAHSLKGNDRLAFIIECAGPVGGINVEANADLEVRGYLKNDHIEVKEPLESFDLNDFFGPGFLTVSRYSGKSSQPFSGQVALEFGSTAKNMSLYFLESEQIPSIVDLSIQFDDLGLIQSAGGFLIQALPGASDDELKTMEDIFNSKTLPSLGKAMESGRSVEEYMLKNMSDFNPRFLDEKEPAFACPCNKQLFHKYLQTLPVSDRQDIMANGPFPLETLCHNCGSAYEFTKEELEKILSNAEDLPS